MGTKVEVSEEALENIFDAGFKCSTNDFNQERFADVSWSLNQGIWDFHAEFRKWRRSTDGKALVNKVNAYVQQTMDRAVMNALEEGLAKGRDENSLRKRLQDALFGFIREEDLDDGEYSDY